MDAHTRHILELDRVLDVIARQAISSAGQDAVRTLEPSVSENAVRERLRPVEELIRLFENNETLPLAGLFDANPLLDEASVEGSVLARPHWPRIARFLDVCTAMERFAKVRRDDCPALSAEASDILSDTELRGTIGQLFEVRGKDLTDELCDDASPELAAARRSLRKAEQGILRTVARLVSTWHGKGWLQEAFSTTRNGRHVLPFKLASKNRVTGIVHGTSASGETVYIEPAEVVEETNAMEEFRQREQLEEHRILRTLTTRLRLWVPPGQLAMLRLTRLDAWFAIASHAYRHGWRIPVIERDGALRLLQAHHPLLHLDRPKESVPISLTLSREDQVLVISGPNTGGKTTAMKTIGLTVLLLQCGIPAPVSPDSRVPMFRGVFADIGDSQDLTAGVSTFSGHIRRLRAILEEVNDAHDVQKRLGESPHPTGLVLLDEVGTGTDPMEGSALAVAILEAFLNRAELTIGTSHHDLVKQWAGETDGARNASFALDPGTGRPTYRVRVDLPGASEALSIARHEGIPAAIIERARELTGPERIRLGDLLNSIEERERRVTEQLRAAESHTAALQQQEQLARIRAEQLREERQESKRQLAEDRERLAKEMRERLDQLIADLSTEDELLRRRRAELVEERRNLIAEQSRATVERKEAERAMPRREDELKQLRTGQRVFVEALREMGEVLSVSADGKRVRVALGSVEFEARREDIFDGDPRLERARALARAEQQAKSTTTAPAGSAKKTRRSKKLKAALLELDNASEPELPSKKRKFQAIPNRTVTAVKPKTRPALEVNLHGMRVEESLELVDKQLNAAMLADYPYLRINHGTGTGRLYRAVHEFLRGYPGVKSFRFANQEEGGGGVTIVEL